MRVQGTGLTLRSRGGTSRFMETSHPLGLDLEDPDLGHTAVLWS